MRWYWQCFFDSCKTVFPFQDRLRQIKHGACGFQPDSSKDAFTIRQGIGQVQWLRSVLPLGSSTVLEMGSGWQPMIPILFSLAGTARVLVTDLSRLCTPQTFQAALHSLRQDKQLIIQELAVDEKTFDEATRWDPASRLEDAFKRLRLEYHAPCDSTNLPFPEASIDAVTSRAVLEHIPPEIIARIFKDTFRVLKRGGYACHLVDNSDHWQHRDASISKLNFLRYSDSTFGLTCLHPLNYQNRLRHPEYVEMLVKAGFKIVREEPIVDPEALRDLKSLPLAQRFQGFREQDLATLTSLVLAVKEPA